MVIFKDNKYYTKYTYKTEAEFETDVVDNASVFFGKKTIYIDAKKKITSKILGNSIPDGFLFDLKDTENPEFYIVANQFHTTKYLQTPYLRGTNALHPHYGGFR